MKTVTMDFEIYKKELEVEYEKGKTNGTEGFKIATRLIKSIINRDHSVKEQEFYIWLRDFGDKS